jgi:hypothetical protein
VSYNPNLSAVPWKEGRVQTKAIVGRGGRVRGASLQVIKLPQHGKICPTLIFHSLRLGESGESGVSLLSPHPASRVSSRRRKKKLSICCRETLNDPRLKAPLASQKRGNLSLGSSFLPIAPAKD